jgi:hypothetical protein
MRLASFAVFLERRKNKQNYKSKQVLLLQINHWVYQRILRMFHSLQAGRKEERYLV